MEILTENTAVNELLCYIQCTIGRQVDSVIAHRVISFYNNIEIKQARTLLRKITNPNSNYQWMHERDNLTMVSEIIRFMGDQEVPRFLCENIYKIPPRTVDEISPSQILLDDVDNIRDSLHKISSVVGKMENVMNKQSHAIESLSVRTETVHSEVVSAKANTDVVLECTTSLRKTISSMNQHTPEVCAMVKDNWPPQATPDVDMHENSLHVRPLCDQRNSSMVQQNSPTQSTPENSVIIQIDDEEIEYIPADSSIRCNWGSFSHDLGVQDNDQPITQTPRSSESQTCCVELSRVEAHVTSEHMSHLLKSQGFNIISCQKLGPYNRYATFSKFIVIIPRCEETSLLTNRQLLENNTVVRSMNPLHSNRSFFVEDQRSSFRPRGPQRRRPTNNWPPRIHAHRQQPRNWQEGRIPNSQETRYQGQTRFHSREPTSTYY